MVERERVCGGRQRKLGVVWKLYFQALVCHRRIKIDFFLTIRLVSNFIVHISKLKTHCLSISEPIKPKEQADVQYFGQSHCASHGFEPINLKFKKLIKIFINYN